MCQDCGNCVVRGCCQCYQGKESPDGIEANRCDTCKAVWMVGGWLCKKCHSCRDTCCACRHEEPAPREMKMEMLLLPPPEPDVVAGDSVPWSDTDFFPDDPHEKGGQR